MLKSHLIHTVIITAALLLLLIFIFSMSAQSGSTSDSLSRKVTGFILSIFAPDFDLLTEDEQLQMISACDLYVRKAAHFTEFGFLGFLFSLFWGRIPRIKHPFLLSLLCGVVCAVFDETHQNFVDGRGPAITDVLIDSSGAVIGILAGLLLIRLIYHHRKLDKKASGDII